MNAKKIHRDASTGQIVSAAYAAANPRTTMSELVGGSTRNDRQVVRSTVDGRFKTQGYADRYPHLTVKQYV